MKKKFIAATLAMMLSMPVHAEIDTAGLSELQKAELQRQAAEMKAIDHTPEKVMQYAELADTLSGTLTKTAEKLGVVANDFVNSPVGIMTAGVIMWRYVGESVVNFVSGMLMLIVSSVACMKWYGMLSVKNIEYDTEHTNWLGQYKIKNKAVDPPNTEMGLFIVGVWVFLTVVAIAVAV